MYLTQEDYKPDLIYVHDCQILINTAVIHIYCQLQIIIVLLYTKSMSVYFTIQYLQKAHNYELNTFWCATHAKLSFT